jgi:hypothetical protein
MNNITSYTSPLKYISVLKCYHRLSILYVNDYYNEIINKEKKNINYLFLLSRVFLNYSTDIVNDELVEYYFIDLYKNESREYGDNKKNKFIADIEKG